jgi:peptidoglycan/LPS O-acetylase OafA/YrhL
MGRKTKHGAREKMSSTQRNARLDWLRGISALIVCAGHTRNALLPDYADLPNHGLLEQAVYFLTGYGHAAVIVFFVLSGYLVGGAVLAPGSNFTWRTYLVNRYVRLWVVLLPALAWTWFMDQQTLALAPQVLTGGLSQNWHSLPALGEYSASWQTFFMNMAFQQTANSPIFGSNGPLWSLANEAWYYLLFPLVALPLKEKRWQVAMTHLPLAGLIFAFMPKDMALLFPVWVAGAMIRKMPIRFLTGKPMYGVIFAAAFFEMLIANKRQAFNQIDALAWDWLIALPCMLWVAYLVQNKSRAPLSLPNRMAIKLSDFSYSLYLVHMPMAVFFGAMLSLPLKRPGHPADFVIFFFALAVEVVFAYAFWWVFERRTNLLKNAVLRWLAAQRDSS